MEVIAFFVVVALLVFFPARKAVNHLNTTLTSLHTEVMVQRTNCLHTLQSQGLQQITLLGEIAGSMKEISVLTKTQNAGMREWLDKQK